MTRIAGKFTFGLDLNLLSTDMGLLMGRGNDAINDTLLSVARQYPSNLVTHQLKDIPRIAYHIRLACGSSDIKELRICDLGGGVGLFSVVCAALGARVLLVDDFDDPVNHEVGSSILQLHERFGVSVLTRDVTRTGLGDLDEEFDVVTSFDSMEHWHHSPKNLFHRVRQLLSPKGRFVLGVPNCVNLRKRISVPFGRGKWSSMDDWYESAVFRGHVREPDVSDLLYIAKDIGLENTRIYGRNWLGRSSGSQMVRVLTSLLDYPLRLWPSLCSDIYMVGEKSP